ncbi:hypothetical protein [Pedobacter sp. L105]|uniref:hypothetical protein n=1 Tax=Pedobacter sp. L105 TaxID=1641871 RepID=UPI00131EC0DC|nr:hypothetical protein [Pedobacter sp. L105]
MKRFLVFLLLSAPVLAVAQSNYIKGYIVTSSKDTLKGYIDYKERGVNPVSFSFKSDLKDKPRVVELKDCSAFAIGDIDAYEKYTVDISMSTTDISNLSTGLDSSSRKDIVFLKVLQKGQNVSLFSYRDHLKTRYYLKDREDAVPYELSRQVFYDREHAGVIVTTDKYKRQILMVLRKFNINSLPVERKLESLNYRDNDLSDIVALINHKKAVQSKYSKARFFAGAGLSINKTKYTGQNDLAGPGATNKKSYSPILTGGIDLFGNPAIGKLILRLQVSLQMAKSEVSATTTHTDKPFVDASFTQYLATFSPQIIYNIYNTNSLKFFIGGGFDLNLPSYSKNEYFSLTSFGQKNYRDDYETFSSLNLSIPFSAGVVLHKNVELSIGYTVPFNITNNGNSYEIQMQKYKVGVSYLFGKH